MTDSNELPSNLLSMETFMRLTQLGCAVTASRKTARAKQRTSRASEANQFHSGSACAANPVYGKAASL